VRKTLTSLNKATGVLIFSIENKSYVHFIFIWHVLYLRGINTNIILKTSHAPLIQNTFIWNSISSEDEQTEK
jgi:hypothetical protein